GGEGGAARAEDLRDPRRIPGRASVAPTSRATGGARRAGKAVRATPRVVLLVGSLSVVQLLRLLGRGAMTVESFPPVADVLPHRGRMVLLSRILEHPTSERRAPWRSTQMRRSSDPRDGVPPWAASDSWPRAAPPQPALGA